MLRANTVTQTAAILSTILTPDIPTRRLDVKIRNENPSKLDEAFRIYGALSLFGIGFSFIISYYRALSSSTYLGSIYYGIAVSTQ